MRILPFDAVVFDLDGVITKTAKIHTAAWTETFNRFLKLHADKHGLSFKEFTHKDDYLPYVDGKPRYKGVQSFLDSRGIELPHGDPSDPPNLDTICGLGNLKNKQFNELIQNGTVDVYYSTLDLIKQLKKHGIKIGVASSSKNCQTILEVVGIVDLFETRVDGVVSAELGLLGKPEPDIFL
ncbi:MAG: HAD hydrolase-like protein, partial [Desulfobacteraceae bacterium]|nr:HAD hydrolase-like protein [Desulfobacteraceae bacterium]